MSVKGFASLIDIILCCSLVISEKADVCIKESDCHGEMEQGDTVSTTTSLAVVLYDEEKVLPHQKPSRHFELAGQTFKIAQDWNGLGVAAVVWDSAIVLAEYLYEHQHLVQGKRIIELGAGTGLAGLVAASLGGEVVVTERAEAIDHLTKTINSNIHDKSWNITPQVLDWTRPFEKTLTGKFDLILGADIVYIEDTFQDLLRTLKHLTASGQTSVLLSCRIRYDRDLRFLKMLEEFFHVKDIYFNDEKGIKIFSVDRKL